MTIPQFKMQVDLKIMQQRPSGRYERNDDTTRCIQRPEFTRNDIQPDLSQLLFRARKRGIRLRCCQRNHTQSAQRWEENQGFQRFLSLTQDVQSLHSGVWREMFLILSDRANAEENENVS